MSNEKLNSSASSECSSQNEKYRVLTEEELTQVSGGMDNLWRCIDCGYLNDDKATRCWLCKRLRG